MDSIRDRLGIFAKTFPRDSVEAMLDAVRDAGVRFSQFNLSCAGLPTLPDALSDEQCERIKKAHRERGLKMVAISGTFNPLDEDRSRLEDNLRRFEVLASRCLDLDTHIITLCTGTRDQGDMWRSHPGNRDPSAWDDMVAIMRRIVAIAESRNVYVAFEPETANVVDTAEKARRLLDEVGSLRLKVVLDPANLFRPSNIGRMRAVLDDAFEQLIGALHVILLHAKDIVPDGSATTVPGRGVLDYRHLGALLRDHGLSWQPIILHGMMEGEARSALDYVASQLRGDPEDF